MLEIERFGTHEVSFYISYVKMKYLLQMIQHPFDFRDLAHGPIDV